jgi:hypothetical protein
MDSAVETLYNDADLSEASWNYFKAAGNYLVPWSTGDEAESEAGEEDTQTYPSYCGVETVAAITSYGDD